MTFIFTIRLLNYLTLNVVLQLVLIPGPQVQTLYHTPQSVIQTLKTPFGVPMRSTLYILYVTHSCLLGETRCNMVKPSL